MAVFLAITILGLILVISIILAMWLCKPHKSTGWISSIFRLSGAILLGNIIFRLLFKFAIWFLTLSIN